MSLCLKYIYGTLDLLIVLVELLLKKKNDYNNLKKLEI